MAEPGGGLPDSYHQQIENLKREQSSKLSQLANEISTWLEELHKMLPTSGQASLDPFKLDRMKSFVGSLYEWHQKASLVDSGWLEKVGELKNQITSLVAAAESKVEELDEKKNDHNAKLETLASGIIELKEAKTLFATLRESLVAENEKLKSAAVEDLTKITQLRVDVGKRDAEITELKKTHSALDKGHREAAEKSKFDATQAHKILEEENTSLKEQNQDLQAELQLLKDDMANQVATKVATARAEIETNYQQAFEEKIQKLDEKNQQLDAHLTTIAEYVRTLSTIQETSDTLSTSTQALVTLEDAVKSFTRLTTDLATQRATSAEKILEVNTKMDKTLEEFKRSLANTAATYKTSERDRYNIEQVLTTVEHELNALVSKMVKSEDLKLLNAATAKILAVLLVDYPNLQASLNEISDRLPDEALNQEGITTTLKQELGGMFRVKDGKFQFQSDIDEKIDGLAKKLSDEMQGQATVTSTALAQATGNLLTVDTFNTHMNPITEKVTASETALDEINTKLVKDSLIFGELAKSEDVDELKQTTAKISGALALDDEPVLPKVVQEVAALSKHLKDADMPTQLTQLTTGVKAILAKSEDVDELKQTTAKISGALALDDEPILPKIVDQVIALGKHLEYVNMPTKFTELNDGITSISANTKGLIERLPIVEGTETLVLQQDIKTLNDKVGQIDTKLPNDIPNLDQVSGSMKTVLDTKLPQAEDGTLKIVTAVGETIGAAQQAIVKAFKDETESTVNQNADFAIQTRDETEKSLKEFSGKLTETGQVQQEIKATQDKIKASVEAQKTQIDQIQAKDSMAEFVKKHKIPDDGISNLYKKISSMPLKDDIRDAAKEGAKSQIDESMKQLKENSFVATLDRNEITEKMFSDAIAIMPNVARQEHITSLKEGLSKTIEEVQGNIKVFDAEVVKDLKQDLAKLATKEEIGHPIQEEAFTKGTKNISTEDNIQISIVQPVLRGINEGINSVFEITTGEPITKQFLMEKVSEVMKELNKDLATKEATDEIASRLEKVEEAGKAALTMEQLQDIMGRLQGHLAEPKPAAEGRTTSVVQDALETTELIGSIEGVEGENDIESEEAVEASGDADQPVPSSTTTRRLSMRALQTPDLLSPTFPATHGTKPQRSTPRSGRIDNPKRLRVGDTASPAEMIISWRRDNNILYEQAQKIASSRIDDTIVADVNQVLEQWDSLREAHDNLPKRTKDMAIDVLTAEGVQIPSDPAYESENDELAINVHIHNLMIRMIKKIDQWFQVEYESEMVTIEAQQVSDDDALTRTTLTRQDALNILHRQEAFATQSDNRLIMFHAEHVMKEIDGVATLRERERRVKATAVKICNAARPKTVPGYMSHTESSRRSITTSLGRQGSFRSRGIVHQSSSSSLAQRSGRTSPVRPKASDVFTDDSTHTPVTVTGAQPLPLTSQLTLPSRNIRSASGSPSSRQDRGGVISPTPGALGSDTPVTIPQRRSSRQAPTQAEKQVEKAKSQASLKSQGSAELALHGTAEYEQWRADVQADALFAMLAFEDNWDTDKLDDFRNKFLALDGTKRTLKEMDKLALGTKGKDSNGNTRHKCFFAQAKGYVAVPNVQSERRADCPAHKSNTKLLAGQRNTLGEPCVFVTFQNGIQIPNAPDEAFDINRQTVNGVRYIIKERT